MNQKCVSHCKQSEFQLVKETGVLFRIKVRLEAFPNRLPISVLSGCFCIIRVYSL